MSLETVTPQTNGSNYSGFYVPIVELQESQECLLKYVMIGFSYIGMTSRCVVFLLAEGNWALQLSPVFFVLFFNKNKLCVLFKC